MRRLGLEGVISLQKLWFWIAENKPKGILEGGPEDIEIAAEWNGEINAFYDCLINIGFLIKHDDGKLELRNWRKHNAWASGAHERSLKAKKAACTKHKKSCNGCKDNCDNSIPFCSKHAWSTAPTPSPIPLPSPLPSPKPARKKKKDKPIRHKYGSYKHVLLTDDQHAKLVDEFGTDRANDLIDKLDKGIESKGYKYKNFYQTILNWAEKDFNKGKSDPKESSIAQHNQQILEQMQKERDGE
jgi:hypothetical protein